LSRATSRSAASIVSPCDHPPVALVVEHLEDVSDASEIRRVGKTWLVCGGDVALEDVVAF
jgi:hypothetical protein